MHYVESNRLFRYNKLILICNFWSNQVPSVFSDLFWLLMPVTLNKVWTILKN